MMLACCLMMLPAWCWQRRRSAAFQWKVVGHGGEQAATRHWYRKHMHWRGSWDKPRMTPWRARLQARAKRAALQIDCVRPLRVTAARRTLASRQRRCSCWGNLTRFVSCKCSFSFGAFYCPCLFWPAFIPRLYFLFLFCLPHFRGWLKIGAGLNSSKFGKLFCFLRLCARSFTNAQCVLVTQNHFSKVAWKCGINWNCMSYLCGKCCEGHFPSLCHCILFGPLSYVEGLTASSPSSLDSFCIGEVAHTWRWHSLAVRWSGLRDVADSSLHCKWTIPFHPLVCFWWYWEKTPQDFLVPFYSSSFGLGVCTPCLFDDNGSSCVSVGCKAHLCLILS